MIVDDSEDLDESLESLLSGPSYALVIGIDKYDHFPELKGAVADATAVADVLEGKSPGAVGHSGACFTVIRRTDDSTPATKAGIKSGFSELEKLLDEHNASQRARGASLNARVLIYFAGHGVATTKPEEAAGNTPGYFLPKDADRQQRNFLSMNTVRERIKRLPCHHLLLVLDCCYAGAFQSSTTRAAAMTTPRLYRESVERYLRDPARHVLTSAASDERALDTLADKLLVETLGGNIVLAEHRAELGKQPGVKRYVHGAKSPFAVALVMGLQGDADFPSGAGTGDANPPSDGVITGNEMHLFIENCFTAWGSGGPRFQKPLLFDWPGEPASKGAFIFRNPRKPLLLESACELVAKNNPYQGFLAYGANEAAMFFGRKKLGADLLDMVEKAPVVVVVGASGTGKSSLVGAGVLPALEHKGWLVLPVVRPAEALRALDVPLAALADTVERFFADASGKDVVAVIDQLEELITLRQGITPLEGEKAIARFFEAVDAALAASNGRLHVVYTLRSDFEPHFANPRFAETRLAKALFGEHRKEGRFRVTPMSPDELREVIERPAEARVFRFNPPELVGEIVKEVVDAPGALPLLSFTLSEMYRATPAPSPRATTAL
jgi:hypothetical protein